MYNLFNWSLQCLVQYFLLGRVMPRLSQYLQPNMLSEFGITEEKPVFDSDVREIEFFCKVIR